MRDQTMKQRPSLAAAIITLNEQENIRECLESVEEFVDEIVVLDSFSKDATEKICREYEKVRFFQHSFDGHIQQKNRALEKCASEWILAVDADERVSPELRQSIEEFLAKQPLVHGAKMARLTYHLKKYIRHGGWYPNARYRLIRKGKAFWGGENPHDLLIIEGEGVTLAGDLIHLSFKDLSDQIQTINNFSSIVALTRFNNGKNGSLGRILWKPTSKFFELYFIKKGFLDGIQGFIIAVSSSFSTFLKEAKLFELSRLNSVQPSNLSSSLYQKKRQN
ncbi:MAG: glycosyltransferase family 2 protein [SAR324 cluster bacterium]|nr:glycosyltransferase family 2 protein [SAR324 cluster bacterium]